MHPQSTRNNELIRKAQTGDIEARNALITENKGLIFNAAKRAKHRKDTVEQHIYAATIAFIRCVNAFDPDKGVAFSTYVTRSMVMEVYRHMNGERGVITVPELTGKSSKDRWEAADRARHTISVYAPAANGLASHPIQEPHPKQGKLWEWVADLPDVQREVITLRLRGLTQPQISAVTGLSRGMVHVHNQAAIAMLRARAA